MSANRVVELRDGFAGYLHGVFVEDAKKRRAVSDWARLAAINLQHGLPSHRAELVKTLGADTGRVELRLLRTPQTPQAPAERRASRERAA